MRPISLRETLQTRLAKASRVVILGVGSEFRGDDAAGLLLVRAVESLLAVAPARVPVHLYETETAPENFTGEVRRLQPSHVLMVDAADFQREAGAVGLIDADRAQGISFCTHALGIGLIAHYMHGEAGCEVIILGVQAASLGFGSPVSSEVRDSVAFMAEVVVSALR